MKLLLSTLLLFSSLSIFAKTYKIQKSNDGITFTVNKTTGSDKGFGPTDVKGNFSDFSGMFNYDTKTKKLSKVDVKIDTNSIDTGIEKRDGHLKSADFFDSSNKKKMHITFKSNSPVVVSASGTAKINGDFTMNGVTKNVTLDAVVTEANGKAMVVAKTSLNRLDYKMGYNKKIDDGFIAKFGNAVKKYIGQNVIGNNVHVKINISAM